MADEPDEVHARRTRRAELPATYIDTWATLTWRGHIRFAVGEWLAGDANYRAAFVMELEDAKEFAETLLKRITARLAKDEPLEKKDADLEGES